MDHFFIDAKYDKDVKLNKETLDYCKQFKVVAVFAAVQYISRLDAVLEQLKEANITVISSQPDRTNAQYQILGCDSYKTTLNLEQEPDAYLYVGDGVFHPRALVLAQKDEAEFKMIVRYDPIQDKMILMDQSDCSAIFKKYKAGLMKFINAKNVGVILTVKPGQQQFAISKALQEKYPDKSIYYFAENTLDFTHFEDFPFIDVWVNSSCPRIGFDDAAHLEKNVINVTDAFNVNDILSKESLLTK